jgi:hypothetical protein
MSSSSTKELSLIDIASNLAQDVRRLTTLKLSSLQCSQIESLESCVELRSLDVSKNALADLQCVEHSYSLRVLNANENKLRSLSDVARLGKLTVLKIGQNKFKSLRGVGALSSLNALVANDNKLTGPLDALCTMTALNTLVLSNNSTLDGTLIGVGGLTQLRKLSIANIGLRALPQWIGSFHVLQELRMNRNALVSLDGIVPTLSALKIVDVGRNRLPSTSALEPLRALPSLRQLNVAGNPLCSDYGQVDEYRATLMTLFPSVEILDGRPTPTSRRADLNRKRSRQTAAAHHQRGGAGGDDDDDDSKVALDSKKRQRRRDDEEEERDTEKQKQKQKDDEQDRAERKRQRTLEKQERKAQRAEKRKRKAEKDEQEARQQQEEARALESGIVNVRAVGGDKKRTQRQQSTQDKDALSFLLSTDDDSVPSW